MRSNFAPRIWRPGTTPVGDAKVDWSRPLAQGLVSLLLVNGNSAVDVVSGLPGTYTTATPVGSARGAAMNFPAAGNVSFASTAAIGPVGGITIAAWINVADFGTYRGIIGKTLSNYPAPYDFYLTGGGGVPSVFRGDGAAVRGYTALSAPATGVWQHVVAQVDSANTTGTFYLNGAANGTGSSTSSTGSTSVANGTGAALVGSRADGVTQFSGKIQSVTIYNRVLSATEVAQLYNDSFAFLVPAAPRTFFVGATIASAAPPPMRINFGARAPSIPESLAMFAAAAVITNPDTTRRGLLGQRRPQTTKGPGC